jgi:hypothetical protein
MEVGDGSLVVALKGRVAGDYDVLLSFGASLLRGSPFVASLRAGRPSEMTCITLLDGLHAGGLGNVRPFPMPNPTPHLLRDDAAGDRRLELSGLGVRIWVRVGVRGVRRLRWLPMLSPSLSPSVCVAGHGHQLIDQMDAARFTD